MRVLLSQNDLYLKNKLEASFNSLLEDRVYPGSGFCHGLEMFIAK
jgi:hypothetical protein